jgi:hypothetical protein
MSQTATNAVYGASSAANSATSNINTATGDVNTVSTDVGNVKNTFSSWDQCMTQDYCKYGRRCGAERVRPLTSHRYPAIIGIVLGSLFLLSIVLCIARCLCCGVECCCACCSCLNACCPSPRRGGNRGGRYSGMNDNAPAINNHYHGSPNGGYQPGPAPPVYNPKPPYAQFDAGTKYRGNEDALPDMPTWDAAGNRKVLDENNDMELGRLNPLDEQRQPMLGPNATSPRAEYELPAAAALPYQRYGAGQGGGDPGAPYGQQNFAGSTAYGGAAAYAAQGQRSPSSGPAQPYGAAAAANPAYRSASPYQQPAGSSYAPSEAASTRYEPTASYGGQESGIVYNARPSPAHQPYSGSAGLPAVRRPVQDTWREV